MALAVELKENDLWQSDLWAASPDPGWTATKLTEDQLIRVLSFIAESNLFEFWDNYVEELVFAKAESSEFQDCYSWLPHANQACATFGSRQQRKIKAIQGEKMSPPWLMIGRLKL